MASDDCPCGSGFSYAACCATYHRGEREAPDASTLMRSRFAAFAKKNVEYIWRTLHRDHDDRSRPRDRVLRELRDACNENRYLGLRILDARGPDANGIAKVLFAAKVFRRGKELSFVECSEFAREGSGWRYLTGEGVNVPFDSVGPMTIDAFVGRV